MSKNSLKTYIPVLLIILLQGCTINIYKNSAPHKTATDQVSSQYTHPEFHATQNDTNIKLTGTVNAAAIMSIGTSPTGPSVSPDHPIALEVELNVDAYVSCFYQQDDGQIIKLFPNRVIPRYRLTANQALRIPGANGFRILTPETKAISKDSFMCVASSEDVTPNLPLELQSNRFQPVSVKNFDSLFRIFSRSTTENLVARVLEVPFQTASPLSRSLSLTAMF